VNGPIEAIVVGAVDLGEADRLVRFLSADEGRVNAVCRGARSSRRRFAGVTDLGSKVLLTRGRRRSALPSASSVEILRGPNHAREDLERIAMLAYGCELCAALAPEGAPAEKLFGLLDRWLLLTEAEPGPTVASRLALEAKAATFAGIGATLTTCAACGGALHDPVVFDPEAGGGLHARCGGGRPVRAASLALVEELRRAPLSESPGRPVPADATWLLADYVRHHLGRDLAARGWWAGLTSEEP
jgi:DNA repair protein RecO (recombination protein O)